MRGAFASAAISASLLLTAPAFAQAEASEQPADANAQSMAWHSAQQTYLLGLKAADGWRYLDGGIRWRWIDYNGSQKRPTIADDITIHYEGKLIDGTVFDSSYERGEPATFPLGRLIPGWQAAIPQMAVGETIEIAIPADLAYGAEGGGPIPGNATLIFKVELLGIGG